MAGINSVCNQLLASPDEPFMPSSLKTLALITYELIMIYTDNTVFV